MAHFKRIFLVTNFPQIFLVANFPPIFCVPKWLKPRCSFCHCPAKKHHRSWIIIYGTCCAKIRFYFTKECVSCMNKNKQNVKKWTKTALDSAATFIQYLQFFSGYRISHDLGYARRRNRSTISSLTNPTNLKLTNCYML